MVDCCAAPQTRMHTVCLYDNLRCPNCLIIYGPLHNDTTVILSVEGVLLCIGHTETTWWPLCGLVTCNDQGGSTGNLNHITQKLRQNLTANPIVKGSLKIWIHGQWTLLFVLSTLSVSDVHNVCVLKLFAGCQLLHPKTMTEVMGN